MAVKVKVWLIEALSYYKKVILDLTLLIILTWGGAYMASDMTQDRWEKTDSFTKRRYYVGYMMVIAGAVKGFFSTAISNAKKAKDDDTSISINKIQ